MTILSKTELATIEANPQESAKATLISNSLPPTYDESQAGTSSMKEAPLPPATNWLEVLKRDKAIDAVYNLDTALQIPAALSPLPTPLTTDRPHLSVRAKDGSVRVTIHLTSGTSERATINIKADDGHIRCNLASRENKQPFKLYAKSDDGHISVKIPRDFHGLFICTAKRGSIKLSPVLQTVARPLSGNRFFIGDLSTLAGDNNEVWKGDEIHLDAHDGYLKFTYNDEPEPAKQGMWAAVKTWIEDI